MSKSLVFGLFVSTLLHPEGVNSVDVPVTTSRGPIIGTVMNGANVFLGVPFANPPTKTLRFMPPQRKNAWASPLPTKTFGNACYQQAALGREMKTGNHLHGMENMALAPLTFSEDCLYLNVFSKNISLMANKPVMVYIHGGSYLHGSGANYGGPGTINNLVNRGVVVVTINYRLAIFGFFSTHTSEIPGNYGLLDQILALKWVQTEISRFGGDPRRVTIFGQSAGGSSVSILTLSPMARGLFQNAIMQSGSAFMPWAVSGNNNINYHSGTLTAQKANCTWNNQLLQCLQLIPTKALYQAAVAAVGDNVVWRPTMDGTKGVIPDTLTNLAKTRPTNVSLMIGTTHDEAANFWMSVLEKNQYFISNFTKAFDLYAVSADPEFKARFGNSINKLVSMIKLAYIDTTTPPIPTMAHKQWLDLIIQIESGYLFFPGAVMDFQMARMYGNENVYVYSFDYQSDALPYPQGYKCTPHLLDLSFIFQNPNLLTGFNWQFSTSDMEVSTELGKLWTSFAINRKPTIPNSPFNWVPINASNPDQFLSINIPSVFKQFYHRRSSNLWNVVIPSVFGPPTTKNPTQVPTQPTTTMMSTQAPTQAQTTQKSAANSFGFSGFVIGVLSIYCIF